jgi:hypothetical protein
MFSAGDPLASGASAAPLRVPHPWGDYRVVRARDTDLFAIQADGNYVYATGRYRARGTGDRVVYVLLGIV